MNDRFLSLITLSKRANRLILGFDTVKEGIEAGKVKLVLLAKDLSPKTEKEVRFLCEKSQLPVCRTEYPMDLFWSQVGKRVGVLGIADEGFAKRMMEENHLGQKEANQL